MPRVRIRRGQIRRTRSGFLSDRVPKPPDGWGDIETTETGNDTKDLIESIEEADDGLGVFEGDPRI